MVIGTIFYNGFNLLLDIVFVYVAYRIGKSVGYRKGYYDCETDLIPF